VSVEAPGASEADERVVRAMRAGLRRCAQLAQDDDPDASGKIQIQIRVAADGKVSSVEQAGQSSLPAREVACMTDRAKAGHFEAGSARTIRVEVRHSKQE
jgi:hypothetical protein